MNTEANLPPNESIPPNTMSIYGQNDAMDDFPVLKAFQKYIDAEQAKAQKRMTTLCMFFAVILAIVIGVFVLLLLNVGNRNNELSEQLFQFMMKERERQTQVPSVQNNDATVKTLTDSMAAMQKQMNEQQMKMLEQQAKFLEQQAKAAEEKVKQMVPTQVQIDKEINQKRVEDDERIKKAVSLLSAEKEKLAKEKEALRQEKLDLQRRKLYPEYYAKEDTKKKNVAEGKQIKKQTPKPQVKNVVDDNDELDDLNSSDTDDDEFISYFDDDDDEDIKPQKKATQTKSQKSPVKQQKVTEQKTVEQDTKSELPLPLPKEKSTTISDWEIPLD